MPINDNDDGIEFIGWSHPSPPNTTIDNNPVTGISAHSPTVEIGRLPGTDAPGKYFDGDDNKALFRCPVVSRKHAKIAFSDSGFAYIIDLTSHHGTYLLQGQSEQPEKLKPEIPSASWIMRRLLSARPWARAMRPSILFSAPFEVSDEDSVYNDSDVEEIPPPLPPPPATAPPPIPAQMHTPEQPSSMGRALEVLKTLIPPAHTPFARYQPSLPPPVNNYIDRESYSPFPPVYTPEYSPGFGDEFGDFLSGGIEYYDPPAREG
ncbi:hypothetical protein BDQ17DRAFT_1424189 [Cyathus striatus]|nr:hypothetical protein BDQ17DRAFT_1424189 [Cyathus striatus]